MTVHFVCSTWPATHRHIYVEPVVAVLSQQFQAIGLVSEMKSTQFLGILIIVTITLVTTSGKWSSLTHQLGAGRAFNCRVDPGGMQG